ncbi:MAG: prolipoprotein diacylglyceryl transferase [Crocinitomicaceae bacterium]
MNILSVVWNFEPRVVPSWEMPVWYGIMWALGFLIGFKILQKMYASENVPQKLLDQSFIYVMAGGILGARLGHCLFYEPAAYLSNPIEILYIWEGGLASHGGAFGIIIATYILARKHTDISVLWLLDRFVVPTALAGFLIRMGNLFNSEIVGKATGSDFGFQFIRHDIPAYLARQITGIKDANPSAAYDKLLSDPQYAQYIADNVPNRYPTQLYEAICYLVFFGILMFFYWKTNAAKLTGFLLGGFFILIFGARFLIEFMKENQDGFDRELEGLNMGQYLSIPLVLVGVFLVARKIKSLRKGKETI